MTNFMVFFFLKKEVINLSFCCSKVHKFQNTLLILSLNFLRQFQTIFHNGEKKVESLSKYTLTNCGSTVGFIFSLQF